MTVEIMAARTKPAETYASTALPSPKRAWYIVGLSMVALMMSYLDRQILALMIEPVKATLGLSDLQFGLLHGLAFSLFFAGIGLPVAILSDRASRVRIIVLSIAFWSVATLTCGLARNFMQLFVARIGVGAGEAGLAPAAYSLFADVIPRDRLGRAAAIFSLGSFLGAGFAFLVGGWLIGVTERLGPQVIAGIFFHPWQLVFLVVALPGMLLALIFHATVQEPARQTPAVQSESGGYRPVWAMLRRRRRVFLPHILGCSVQAMALFTTLGWSAAYLIRVFALPPAVAGLYLSAIIFLFGSAGIMTSGLLTDALVRRGRADGPFVTLVAGGMGLATVAIWLPFMPSLGGALALLCGIVFFASFPMPPSTVVIQLGAPAHMRSRVSAIFLCVNSLIGLALGSALVGFLNDRIFTARDGVASSMALVMVCAATLSCIILRQGAKPYAALRDDD